MRLPDWKTCAGYLVVIATLALSMPGVQVVRADDEVVAVSVGLVDSAPSCDPNSVDGVAKSATVLLTLTPDGSEVSHPVALNNQGYSYQLPCVNV